MTTKLDHQSDLMYDGEKKRRNTVANEAAKRKAVEKTMDELYKWIDELHSEINTAKGAVQDARKEAKKTVASKNKIDSIALTA